LIVTLTVSGGGKVLLGFAPLLAMIILGSLLLWPAFVPGKIHVAGYLTEEGLIFGLGMGMRLMAFSVLGMLYLLTSPVEETAWAMHRLGLPYVVSFGIVMAFRLMERISKTAETVVAAQRSRGLTVDKGSMVQRWRSYVPLLVPILVLSMRRVDGMAMAMESRAFSPIARRTSLLNFKMRLRDWTALLAAAVLLGLAIWLRVQGYGVLISGRL